MSDPVNEIMNSEEPPTIESNNNIVIEEQGPGPVEEPEVVLNEAQQVTGVKTEKQQGAAEASRLRREAKNEEPEPVVEEEPPAVVEEPEPDVEEPVVEEPEPVEEEEPTPVVEEPEPVEEEEPTPVVEEPEPVVVEEPVEEPAVEEPVVEEPVVEEPVVEEPVVEEPVISYDHVCSLQTLTQVLGKWSGGEIRRRNVESLLKEGTETDENLDTIEKVVEILKQWIQKGGSEFRKNNLFLNIDEYTFQGESHNLSVQKKNEILKILTELTINVSQRKLNDQEINTILNNLY